MLIHSTCFTDRYRAILDARLAFKTVKGFAIHFVFGTKEELEGWPKKEFLGGEDIVRKAAEMESPKIGTNFTFRDS